MTATPSSAWVRPLLACLLVAVVAACGGRARTAAPPATPGVTASGLEPGIWAGGAEDEGPVLDPAEVQPVAGGSPRRAFARLAPRSGSATTGAATFEERNGRVTVTLLVAGTAPGRHGVHVHARGDCGAADASSAGAHLDPDNLPHGGPDRAPHHAGDLGNVVVDGDGSGRLVISTPDLTVAPGRRSVVGRSIVVHAAADDLGTQPAGGSGGRIACGVIVAR